MSFGAPWVLLLIPLLWWWARGDGLRSALPVASVQPWSGGRRGRARILWLPPTLRRLAVALVLTALAWPQGDASDQEEVSEGIAIQLLVDVSSSMDMTLEGPEGERLTRMDLAKKMVERFIAGDGGALRGRPHDLIGLITFARYADTRSPLTFGHEALLQIVRGLQIQERPNEDGTAYGDALAIAAARLQNLEELKSAGRGQAAEALSSKIIILLTDGENNSGAHLPTEAAGLAKAWGCRIYVVSLGESIGPEALLEELSPAERVLEHLAQETGGVFRQAHDYASLKSVYGEIDQLERSEISLRSFERVAEWFWLPLLGAVGALVSALFLEATWLRVVP
ncbi:MAG: VWA domain-containing protein [Verrucomicrobiota bacterium]